MRRNDSADARDATIGLQPLETRNNRRLVGAQRRRDGFEGPRRELTRYRELVARPERSDDELLEIIDLYLALVAAGEFTHKRLDRVHRFAKELGTEARCSERHALQMERLRQLERE